MTNDEKYNNGNRQQDELCVNEDILRVINTFHYTEKFRDDPVDKAMIERILLAGRMAPSGHNMQTWRFTVLTKHENISGITDKNPCVMILVSNDRRNPHGEYDSVAAIENIMLSAHAFGLGVCRIDSCDDFRGRFGIPENHVVYGAVGLGWPA